MSEDDKRIAEKIWPQHMPKPDQYSDRREAAKAWLGDRYLLAVKAKRK